MKVLHKFYSPTRYWVPIDHRHSVEQQHGVQLWLDLIQEWLFVGLKLLGRFEIYLVFNHIRPWGQGNSEPPKTFSFPPFICIFLQMEMWKAQFQVLVYTFLNNGSFIKTQSITSRWYNSTEAILGLCMKSFVSGLTINNTRKKICLHLWDASDAGSHQHLAYCNRLTTWSEIQTQIKDFKIQRSKTIWYRDVSVSQGIFLDQSKSPN